MWHGKVRFRRVGANDPYLQHPRKKGAQRTFQKQKKMFLFPSSAFDAQVYAMRQGSRINARDVQICPHVRIM